VIQTAIKYDLEVMEEGRVELRVPFPSGAQITVFVIYEPAEAFEDLMVAAQSSLDFWDNPFDDQDWNNV